MSPLRLIEVKNNRLNGISNVTDNVSLSICGFNSPEHLSRERQSFSEIEFLLSTLSLLLVDEESNF